MGGSQPPKTAEKEPEQPVPILLVDDRHEDLLALTELLSDPRYELVTASSGDEALRKVLARDYAVILLDVVMPGLDGFEVASIIKSRSRSRHTPILFLTSANQDIGALYRAYSVGAVDYLSKPVDEAIVRAKVSIFAELFRKEQRIQEQARALVEADRRERDLQLQRMRLLSEKRYRTLVETIPASVFTADHEGAVTYCNHHLSDLTGLELGRVRGKGWLGAAHREDAIRVEKEWGEAISRGEAYRTELRLRLADGSWRWHLCHVVPEQDEEGQIRGWLGMFAECEDLKRAIESRDEFLSIASHELRTPLSTMLLQLEALSRGAAPKLDERALRKLQSALRQTVRLNDLVNSLLDIGRIAAGRLTLEPDQLDLGPLVKECGERFTDEASRVGSSLAISIEGEPKGKWDRLRLEQVVANLLSNAIKYGNGQPIEVHVEGRDTSARIRVRDRGIGIPSDRQGRIFERFERAVSARHYGGLGMGLYITRQIVEAHGGSIVVSSEPGEGATFTVSLPRAVDETHALRPEAPLAAAVRGAVG